MQRFPATKAHVDACCKSAGPSLFAIACTLCGAQPFGCQIQQKTASAARERPYLRLYYAGAPRFNRAECMKTSTPNDVRIYTIASSSITALPEWLSQSRRKQLRYDPNFQQRVELVQDFQFPQTAARLQLSRDEQYIVACGTYKPQMRVFELQQMSMKFERHTHAETVRLEMLADDWRKMVCLQADRTVEFHSHMGLHHRVRLPRYGRDMAYHYATCDMLLAGSGADVWRLNLEQGRFVTSLQSRCDPDGGVNVVEVSAANQLCTLGGADGCAEFWDVREQLPLCRVPVRAQLQSPAGEVTAVAHARDGLTWACGMSDGKVALYDIRAARRPLLVKDHHYGTTIKRVLFHYGGGDDASHQHCISADTKSIRIWERQTGALLTAIEPEDDVNDVLVHQGLIMTANECPRMNIFFVPRLGAAPRWCSFLDSITEELAEDSSSANTAMAAAVWDDYKFLTIAELRHLNMDHLIGTPMLKAYMHGFFVDVRLYEKARAIASPFARDTHRERVVRARMDAQAATRISAASHSQRRKLPAVNAEVAARMMDSKKKSPSGSALQDARFGEMFRDADFQVDPYADEYVKFNTAHPAKTGPAQAESPSVDATGDPSSGDSDN